MKRKKKVDASLYVLLGLTVVAAFVAWRRSPDVLLAGFSATGRTLSTIWPELVLGFVLAGLLDVLIPARTLAAWLGPDRPLRNILVGWGVGLAIPGGPYLVFPIVAGLFEKGAAAGPIIALVTAKTLVSPIRMLTYEAPLLGWPLTLARLLPGLFVPPVLGLIGQWLYVLLRR